MWVVRLCRPQPPRGCVERVRHWYAVYGHPDGVGVRPWFAVDDVTGLVYPRDDEQPTTYAPEPSFRFVEHLIYPVGEETGDQPQPWFELRGSCVYSTDGHPRGASPSPWYQMR